MRDTLESTANDSSGNADSRKTDETTVPIATISLQAGGPRSGRTDWLKERGESAPHHTLDWLEIGESHR